MKRVVLLISIIAFATMGLTFSQNIPRLNVQSIDETKPAKKARQLIKQYYASHQSDTVVSFNIINTLRLLSPLISDSLTKSMIYRCAANFYEQKNLIENAMLHYEKSLNALKDLQSRNADIERSKTLVDKGIVFQKFGENETALSLFLEAEKTFLSYNYVDPLIDVYAKMGDIYLRNGDVERNAAIIGKSTAIIKHIDDPEKLVNYYINMANVYGYSERLDSAFLFFEKANRILDKSQNHYQLGTLYYNIGFFLNQQGKLDLAEENYRKSLSEYQKTGIGYDICDATLRIGGCLYYQKKYAEAKEIVLKALEMANKQKSLLLIRNCFDILSCIEYDLKNYQQAYEYLDEYVSAQTKLTSENVQNRMNFLTVKYETEKKELVISELKDRTNLQRILLIITGILVLILIVLILMSRRYMKQKADLTKQQLIQLEQEKKLSTIQAVLDGEVAERSRIAHDLHDGLGSLLSVVKLNLQDVKSNASLKEETSMLHLDQTIRTLDDSINELSRIAHNMMPESLMQHGLKTALTDFCNVTPSVIFYFFGNDYRIDHKLEILIYRSILELINNALKHADASQINVQLIQEANRISFTVQDNGKGFDVSKQSKGMGLHNIKKRVSAYNGHVNFVSSQGKGTEVIIEFHL
ncbi:MAG: tetratricopeptide repeat protein [Phycisphaerae bacterium]